MLVADQAVDLLLGPKWSGIIPILRLLCVYASIRAVDVLLPPVLFACRRERFLYWYCLVLLLILPATSLLGALWDGAWGLVLVFTPSYSICMAFMAREALFELESSFGELWSQLSSVLVATATMAVIVTLALEIGVASGPPNLMRLSGIVLIGATSYTAALIAMGGPLIHDALQLLSWLRRGHRAGA